MKNKVLLSESELISLIKKVIKEEEYIEQHLEYTHPRAKKLGLENDGLCKIQMAKKDFKEGYTAVLVCTKFDEPMVSAELPVTKETKEELKSFICKNIDRTYELLDEMLSVSDDSLELNEDFKFSKFEVIDEPIVCSSELF